MNFGAVSLFVLVSSLQFFLYEAQVQGSVGAASYAGPARYPETQMGYMPSYPMEPTFYPNLVQGEYMLNNYRPNLFESLYRSIKHGVYRIITFPILLIRLIIFIIKLLLGWNVPSPHPYDVYASSSIQ